MRRLAVVVVGLAGCFTNGKHHTTAYHLDGVAAAVGGFLVVKAPGGLDCMGLDNTPPPLNPTGDGWTPYRECRDNNHRRNLMIGIGGGLLAAAIVGTAINLLVMHGDVEKQDSDTLTPIGDQQTSTEIELMDIGTTNPQLVTLTKEAAFAARKGNCRVVRLIHQRVRALDAEFAATGFIKDNTIERCVTQQDTQ